MERLTTHDPNRQLFVCSANYKSWNEIYDRLAYYEDLDEQGRLVVLPCKVGDTVYRVWPYRKPIITEHKMHDITEIAKYIDAFGITFGKTVFLTREEAEKALEVSENEPI